MASVVLERVGLDRGSRVMFVIAGLVAVSIVVFYTTYENLMSIWVLSNYRHCLLIIPMAFFLLWKRRGRLASTPIRPSWIGVGVSVGLAFLWQLGQATGTQMLAHVAAIGAIPALALALMGWPMFRAAMFPLLFMFAAVPVGDGFVPYLMNATVAVSVTLLQACGIPVYHEGVFVSLPGGEFKVADVCSGLNYLLAAVALSLPLSERLFRSAWKRTVLVVSAAVLFIVGNGVRAFIVMAIASATELRHFAGDDHVVFGMFFFMGLLVLMLWVGGRYADPPAPDVGAPAAPLDDATRNRSLLVGAAAVAVLAAFPVAQAVQSSGPEAQIEQLELPALAGCELAPEWKADWSPQLRDPDTQMKGSYVCGDVTLYVFAGAYAEHRQGREMVSVDNTLVPTIWWWSGSRSDSAFRRPDGRKVALNEVRMADASHPLFAWYWYSVNGRGVRTELDVKIQEVLAALMLRPSESRAYVIAAYGDSRDDLAKLRERVVSTATLVLNGSEP
jgi:exosortase A